MKKLIAILLVVLMCLSVFVACNPVRPNETTDTESESKTEGTTQTESETETEEIEWDVEAAADYVDSLYKQGDVVTASDYVVVGQVLIAGVKYVVTWSVDNELVEAVQGDPYWTINVDEKADEEHTYTLTGTITAGDGTTATVSYERTVPQYNVLSFEEYMAAEEGATVVIEGIVVGINAKSLGNTRNHLFLADLEGKGGYYCYQLDDDPVEGGVELGMTVSVTAVVSPYSGMQETKGGTFTIIDETIKTVEITDITDKLAAGESLKNYVGLVVTVKGVTIGTQELGGTSEYLKFSINGQESYVRTYVTDFPTTLKADDKATIDADHAAHFGYKADATGILVLFSGNPYLIPISTTPFTNYEEVVITPAERVEAEKNELNIGNSFSDNTVIDLPSVGKYFDNVTITWATNDTVNAAIADGKLTIVVPENSVTVTVTATITCGDVTETKTFEITLSKAPITIPEALALPDGSNILVSGTVVEINTAWSEQYGNITVTIEDAEGNTLYIYRMNTNVKVGDIITVKGQMGTYNNARQVAAGSTATIDDPAPVEVTLSDAVTLDDGVRVIVKGTVKEINTPYSEQYGNITLTIEDAEGNTLYIYRLKGNYNVGDVLTITGKVGSYNGSKQIAAGATAVVEGGEDETGSDTGTDPAGPVEVTLSEAVALPDGTDVIVKGTVKQIDTPYSEQYGNISLTIEDAEGNTLYIYRLVGDYKVGDVLTITGKVGSYNGSKQIAAGATAVVAAAGTKYVFADYEAGEQYAANEVHVLDENVTVTTTDAHFTSQLRLYYSAVNDWNPEGRNGIAVFATTSAVKSLSLNAGEKAAPIAVYGSTDGENWTLITTITATATYTDYPVNLGTSAYTFIKLAATEGQVRIASITIELQ